MADATAPILNDYKLIKDFSAPSVLPSDGALRTKKFSTGDVVKGYVPITKPEDNIVPIIITEGEWAIPLQFLVLSSAAANPSATDSVKQVINDVKNNALVQKITATAKGNIHGALIGAGIGVAIAWMLGKNKIVFAGMGAVVGVFVGKKAASTVVPNTTTNGK